MGSHTHYDQRLPYEEYEARLHDSSSGRMHVQSTEAVESPLRVFSAMPLYRHTCIYSYVTPEEQVECQFVVS